eukprot:365615-Chlamydomonas_euryale.AAC.6
MNIPSGGLDLSVHARACVVPHKMWGRLLVIADFNGAAVMQPGCSVAQGDGIHTPGHDAAERQVDDPESVDACTFDSDTFSVGVMMRKLAPHSVRLFFRLIEDWCTQPDPSKPDPSKPDPAKPDPAKPDPAKPDLAKPDPSKPDPAKPDPAKPDPSKPDPAKPDPSKPDPSKPDPAKPDPAKPDPSKPDPAKPDPAKRLHPMLDCSCCRSGRRRAPWSRRMWWQACLTTSRARAKS